MSGGPEPGLGEQEAQGPRGRGQEHRGRPGEGGIPPAPQRPPRTSSRHRASSDMEDTRRSLPAPSAAVHASRGGPGLGPLRLVSLLPGAHVCPAGLSVRLDAPQACPLGPELRTTTWGPFLRPFSASGVCPPAAGHPGLAQGKLLVATDAHRGDPPRITPEGSSRIEGPGATPCSTAQGCRAVTPTPRTPRDPSRGAQAGQCPGAANPQKTTDLGSLEKS